MAKTLERVLDMADELAELRDEVRTLMHVRSNLEARLIKAVRRRDLAKHEARKAALGRARYAREADSWMARYKAAQENLDDANLKLVSARTELAAMRAVSEPTPSEVQSPVATFRSTGARGIPMSEIVGSKSRGK